MENYNEQWDRLNELIVALKEVDLSDLTTGELDSWTAMQERIKAIPQQYNGNPLLQDAEQMKEMADTLVRILANHLK